MLRMAVQTGSPKIPMADRDILRCEKSTAPLFDLSKPIDLEGIVRWSFHLYHY